MAIEDILGGLFPVHALATKGALPGAFGMNMATGGLQDMMGGSESMFGLLSPYLMGEQQPQEQTAFDMTPQQYLSQTPGSPNQPGRVDQNSFMGSQQQMNPLDLLTANIAKRFGG